MTTPFVPGKMYRKNTNSIVYLWDHDWKVVVGCIGPGDTVLCLEDCLEYSMFLTKTGAVGKTCSHMWFVGLVPVEPKTEESHEPR